MEESIDTPIIDLTEYKNKEDVQKRIEEIKKTKKVVATSGYFDPLHHGHVELFKLSKKLGDYLIVIINNDNQTIQKKGFVFMPHSDKAKIIAELSCVDEVFISIDEDQSQCKTLEFLKPHIYAKGGDRYIYEIPETPICKKHNIDLIDGVGAKVESSSDIIKKANEAKSKL
ncbi:MAG: adenylyltransferase/cytidyltransferase family protein [Nanoarchaeota archaeon]|nr:adenylyltransferase/cytidyltransferase family protein [Nanoarchaeota archaeon]